MERFCEIKLYAGVTSTFRVYVLHGAYTLNVLVTLMFVTAGVGLSIKWEFYKVQWEFLSYQMGI